ncbi:hypothetical protein M8494_13650 [Serratia ureilytica]
MAYRHIVVATDLSEDAEFLLGKGASWPPRSMPNFPDLYRHSSRRLLRRSGRGDYNYNRSHLFRAGEEYAQCDQGQSSYPVEEVIAAAAR